MEEQHNEEENKKKRGSMSRSDMEEIIGLFDESRYPSVLLQEFRRTHFGQIWSGEKIIEELKEAFSNGFHGMHFIPLMFEGCIGKILEEYLGDDHYVAYRTCEKHGMLVLQPNYKKLGVSPISRLRASFETDESIHALQQKESWASFCYSSQTSFSTPEG